MRKYGIEHFSVVELEQTNDPEEREKYWIEKLRTFKNGYNATTGGDGKHYLDYDLIIALYKELQNTVLVAKKVNCSVDSVRNILHSHNIEVVSSQEIIRRKNSKVVKQYTQDTHELINIFPSINAAAEALDLGQGRRHISECCNGKRKSAYGYYWEFE